MFHHDYDDEKLISQIYVCFPLPCRLCRSGNETVLNSFKSIGLK